MRTRTIKFLKLKSLICETCFQESTACVFASNGQVFCDICALQAEEAQEAAERAARLRAGWGDENNDVPIRE